MTIVLLCPSVQADSFEVLAGVAPSRTIIIDNQQTIIEISSNCPFDVAPRVYLQARPDQPVAYSANIRDQYIELSKTINFSKPRIVYKKNLASKIQVRAVVAKIVRYIAVIWGQYSRNILTKRNLL